MASTTHHMEVDAPGKPVGASLPDHGQLHVVCLSPQPWSVDLPTNRQQVMTRLAEAGHRVLYVETGQFVGREVAQVFHDRDPRGAFRQLLTAEEAAPGVRVIKAPTVAPWGHRFRLAVRLNSALTALVVRRHVGRTVEPAVLWLYDPCFAGCIGKVGERLAVYDCVDDYAEQAGADRRKRALVAAYDRLAASRARLVFTTAQTLADRHGRHNAKTYLVRNVGDFAHFAPAADRSLVVEKLASLRRPVIGFAGNFLAEKVDFALLEALASRRPEWTLVRVGPARDDTNGALLRLTERDNVRWLGAVPYGDLPRYVAAFDVATIPYLRNAYTRSCFPLKTFEYLAAGKPVVASGLPELEGMEPHVVIAQDVDAFEACVADALTRTTAPEIAARQEIAAKNTWETRTQRLLELITAEL